jgi:cytochrome bd-type quinol oxidase subunit 2
MGFLESLLNPLTKIKNIFTLLGLAVVAVLLIGLGTYIFSFTLPRLIGIFLLVAASVVIFNIGKINKDNRDLARIAFLTLIVIGLLLTIFPQVMDKIQSISLSIVPIK